MYFLSSLFLLFHPFLCGNMKLDLKDPAGRRIDVLIFYRRSTWQVSLLLLLHL